MGNSQADRPGQPDDIRIEAIERVSRLLGELSADQAALKKESQRFTEPLSFVERAIESTHQLEKALRDAKHSGN